MSHVLQTQTTVEQYTHTPHIHHSEIKIILWCDVEKHNYFAQKNWQTSKSIFVTHERKESVSSWNWKWNGLPMIWYRMHHEKCSRKLNRTNRKTQTKQIKSNTSTNNNESAWLLPPIYSWINIETESLALNTTATRRHTFPDLFYCQKCIDSIGFCSVFFVHSFIVQFGSAVFACFVIVVVVDNSQRFTNDVSIYRMWWLTEHKSLLSILYCHSDDPCQMPPHCRSTRSEMKSSFASCRRSLQRKFY